MIVPQHIQSQLSDFISHKFKDIDIDRYSMDSSDWNLTVTGKYSFIMSIRKGRPIDVMVSEIANQKHTEEAFYNRAALEYELNDNIKYE
tara:strand:+ start:170 stop:436 length:267 start_codon:yes stop_codon:yes gene_type:complete